MLPGPAFDPPDRVLVGAIVKPSLGLGPAEVAKVASALAQGGADLIKDDELLGDPDWCRLEDRVKAVMDSIPTEVVYCPNVTGPMGALLYRAERAVELGATGVMVNAFAEGLDAVRLLRDADLGVPVFAHRVGSGAWVRNERFGVAGAVLAKLTRLCGADCVQVGAFSGKLFDADGAVRDQIAACHAPLAGVPRAVAVLGGGMGPDNARAQIDAAAVRSGVMVLLGQAAYRHPGGPEEGVRSTVAALA
jgi:ribulose-bisphosphate carboxylase large chain